MGSRRCLVAALVVVLAGLVVASCRRGDDGAREEPRSGPAPLPEPPWTAAAIAHGGVGSSPQYVDGCRAAVDAALEVLDSGGDAVDAAIAGVIVLEDDPRYNAGTGSRVRIDGATVQMDAAVMRSTGEFGAVAVIEGVRNPVKVARAVIDTPHIMLAGDGATRFARALGMPLYDPTTAEMRAKTAEIIARLRAADPSLPESWTDYDWRKAWNFERTLSEAGLGPGETGTDTVGVAVRSATGGFAVALSTGGTSITLRGRVGDVPILGAGLYAGTHAAVAATGTGERIIEASLSRRVHDDSVDGAAIDVAARRAVDQLRAAGYVGLIVITADAMIGDADRQMAWAGRELGSTSWLGPAAP